MKKCKVTHIIYKPSFFLTILPVDTDLNYLYANNIGRSLIKFWLAKLAFAGMFVFELKTKHSYLKFSENYIVMK